MLMELDQKTEEELREKRIEALFTRAEAGDLDAKANLETLVLLKRLTMDELRRYLKLHF